MRTKRTIIVIISAVMACLCVSPGYSGTILKQGDAFPAITLPGPADQRHQAYLGLTDSGMFRVSDIKAEVLIIEIFSMYCPHCQREAKNVNKLFETIETDERARGKVKLIGIGVGNEAFEVEFFRNKYQVPFPLFEDEDLRIHEQVGSVGTPFFFCVRIGDGGYNRIFYTQIGGFDTADQFLNKILKLSGLAIH